MLDRARAVMPFCFTLGTGAGDEALASTLNHSDCLGSNHALAPIRHDSLQLSLIHEQKYENGW